MFSSSPFPFSPSHLVLCAIAIAGFVGCQKEPPPDPRFDDPALLRPNGSKKLTVVWVDGVPVPAESAGNPRMMPPGNAPALPRSAERTEISWKVPDGWKSVPPSSQLRLAEYRVPSEEPNGESADLGVFYLGPSNTPVEDTLSRWASSFDEASAKRAKRATRGNGAFQASLVEASGTYTVSPMMVPDGADAGDLTHPGWMLLGAIVQTPVGPYYFKLLGPKKAVDDAREDFFKLIDSVGQEADTPASSGSSSAQPQPAPPSAASAASAKPDGKPPTR